MIKWSGDDFWICQLLFQRFGISDISCDQQQDFASIIVNESISSRSFMLFISFPPQANNLKFPPKISLGPKISEPLFNLNRTTFLALQNEHMKIQLYGAYKSWKGKN